MTKRRVRGAGGALRSAWMVTTVLVGAVGCGGDDASTDRVPSMLGSGAVPGADREDGPNQAPVIDAVRVSPARPTPGREVEAVVSVSDPDGDRTTLELQWLSSYTGAVLGEGSRFDTEGLDEGDRVELVVVARDGEAESEPRSFEFEIGGASIEIALVAIDTSEGTQPGALLEAVVESTDEDRGGYDVLYVWRVNDELAGSEDELDTTPFAPGDVVVLEARLDFEDRTSRPVASRPVMLSRGGAPKILSQPLSGVEGGVFRYQVRARSEEPGARLSYELLKGPEGMTVGSETGLVSWRPASEQRGAFEVEVVAKDQWGTGTAQSFEIQVDSPAPPASAR